MIKYLIMKCEELNDQYECDANREPVCLVDDWEQWYKKNKPDYYFEVYKCEDDMPCELVKSYDSYADEGMALYYWSNIDLAEKEPPRIVKKWVNLTDRVSIPAEVKAMFKTLAPDISYKEFLNDMRCTGVSGWEDKLGRWWVYGYYHDGHYSYGY